MKILGLSLMFVDHAGYFYFTEQEWIRGIGRACAPIFFFLAGFAPHYKSADRKLIALAIILTVFDWGIGREMNTLNIIWSILAIRALLGWLEGSGRLKLRLHEWVIGCIVFIIPTVVIFQYGSLGFLVALSAYVYKHRAHYGEKTHLRFLVFIITLYGTVFALLSSFDPLTFATMYASLLLLIGAILWFVRAPMSEAPCPAPLVSSLKTCSRYTAPIYVGHLAVLIILTGKHL
jgi:hypothetical protein